MFTTLRSGTLSEIEVDELKDDDEYDCDRARNPVPVSPFHQPHQPRQPSPYSQSSQSPQYPPSPPSPPQVQVLASTNPSTNPTNPHQPLPTGITPSTLLLPATLRESRLRPDARAKVVAARRWACTPCRRRWRACVQTNGWTWKCRGCAQAGGAGRGCEWFERTGMCFCLSLTSCLCVFGVLFFRVFLSSTLPALLC